MSLYKLVVILLIAIVVSSCSIPTHQYDGIDVWNDSMKSTINVKQSGVEIYNATGIDADYKFSLSCAIGDSCELVEMTKKIGARQIEFIPIDGYDSISVINFSISERIYIAPW